MWLRREPKGEGVALQWRIRSVTITQRSKFNPRKGEKKTKERREREVKKRGMEGRRKEGGEGRGKKDIQVRKKGREGETERRKWKGRESKGKKLKCILFKQYYEPYWDVNHIFPF